jgi:hypothetical protein
MKVIVTLAVAAYFAHLGLSSISQTPAIPIPVAMTTPTVAAAPAAIAPVAMPVQWVRVGG